MKLIAGGRVILSGLVAVLLVVLALWVWSRASELAGAIAPVTVMGGAMASSPPVRLLDAVYAVAIAAAAGAQALLLREVVPVFYTQRRSDEVLQILLGATVVAGLITGVVLLVMSA